MPKNWTNHVFKGKESKNSIYKFRGDNLIPLFWPIRCRDKFKFCDIFRGQEKTTLEGRSWCDFFSSPKIDLSCDIRISFGLFVLMVEKEASKWSIFRFFSSKNHDFSLLWMWSVETVKLLLKCFYNLGHSGSLINPFDIILRFLFVIYRSGNGDFQWFLQRFPLCLYF